MLTFGSQSKYHRRIDGTEVIRQSKQPDHFPSRLLPHYVDLRQWMTPIKDQRDMNTWCVLFLFRILYFSQLSHCSTAAAFASACEYLIKRQTDLYIPISQLFIHFNGQTIDQGTYSVEDDGASRRSVVLGMRKFGICKEELWPYKRRLLNKKPPHNVYVEAKRYIVVPQEIPLDITAIKTCLANQLPALVGIKIKDGPYNHARINGGYLSIPDPDDIAIANTGTHAVLLVGYDDEAQHFIVRNSWGRKWVGATSFSQSCIY
jgi:C1A family cysteine protease